jgi:UDP-GlcNAc:undecaprenyl-phosphate GlcNAc-1-phosphate transferase
LAQSYLRAAFRLNVKTFLTQVAKKSFARDEYLCFNCSQLKRKRISQVERGRLFNSAMHVFLLLICGFCLSAVLCAVLTKLVRDVANQFGFVSGPRSARHIHAKPIPRFGGIAIFSTTVAICVGDFLANHYGLLASGISRDILKLLGPGAALFAAGLVDDLRPISATIKLLIQIAGGVALYLMGFRFVCLSSAPPMHAFGTAICFVATVVWVVWVCNAINLIDGLDGLAAGAALFSMVTIFTVALAEGRDGVGLATVVLAGALLGFLIFNFNPASIFLGDSGSLFVGFMLSGLILAESQKQQTVSDAISIPLIAFALPLTDTALSVLRRFLNGHALFGADREHIHHKLLELGISQRQAVYILYGISAAFAVLGIFLFYGSDLVLMPVAALVLLVLFFGIRRLNYQEFAECARVWGRIRQQKEGFARNVAIRKANIELRKLRDASNLPVLLERALRAEFDGFELSLDPEVVSAKGAEERWSGTMELAWSNGYAEREIVILELSTPMEGLVGRITLHRSAGPGRLVDPDLLSGDFREALGVAIATCILEEPVSLLYVKPLYAMTDAAPNGNHQWSMAQLSTHESVGDQAAE